MQPKNKLLKRPCLLFCSLVILLSSSCKKNEFNEERLDAISIDNAASTKPNIILFLADDMGYEVPTYSGGQSYDTHNLDSIAANGAAFLSCFSHPDGSPSRQALMTGKYNFRNYIKWGSLPTTEKTIANMLRDAGYATCYVGKWQLGRGARGLKNAGFNKYRVFLPFLATKDTYQQIGRYKDPSLYEDGAYMPDSLTKGRYSEDMFYDYVSDFIDNTKKKPFFIVYANTLVGKPFVPTPDDPEFASWNSADDIPMSNSKYFPGMVSYMDKIIGKVIKKVESKGLANNTIILFTADNATSKSIVSLYNGKRIRGHKNYTTKAGTNVPLVAYWPGKIPAGTVDNSLIDFTDFLPTIADIAGVPRPETYGKLDGITFYDNLTGIAGPQRPWVFCQWDNNSKDNVIAQRYIHDQEYKLYDSINGSRFYKISKDPKEDKPLSDDVLTPKQKRQKIQFQAILDEMH